MSAEIMDNDWMFSGNGIRPWHGIGTIVSGAPTSEEAIRLAKLDWDVIQYPMVAKFNEDGTEISDDSGYFANVRSDTKDILGVVKDRYKVVQNIEAFDFVDDIVGNGEIECHYETAGSLGNGKRIFLLVNLPESTLVGDKVDNYLFFTNSHDGSSSLMAGITNVRVVCSNTLQLAIRSASRIWRCRHTTNIEGRKNEAKQSLGLAVKYMEDSKILAEQLAFKKISEEAFFRTLFGVSTMNEKNKVFMGNIIHDIYQNKPDLQNFKGSAWGMYNAVADYVSNCDPLRKTKTYEESKLKGFFDGYKLLQTTQDILMSA